ncbi:MAG: ATP-dependent DNA helicase RecG, partial [Patescibacteria group bacterium]
LIPVYPETKGLTSKGLRYLIKPILNNLEKINDFIPTEVLKKNGLPEINAALKILHFPSELSDAEKSKKRFAFEDLFLLQLTNIKLKNKLAKEKAVALEINKEKLEKIIAKLPFKLTNSQKQSLGEILDDLNKLQPMNRLLQGDVGSGKTVIAAIAAVIAAQNDKQSAFMVPTEVLAKQHYRTMINLFGYLNIPIGLLTNSQIQCFYGEGLETKTKKTDFLQKVAKGELKIVIGTHTLIAGGIIFKDLVFTTVDEQHRFGIEQRATLVRGAGKKPDPSLPHFLSMSATPIPRTLTLTLFGDLDLSTINELPVGRKQIITKIVAPTNRAKAYQFIREQIKKGRQAFVICPRIEANHETQSANNNRHLSWDDVRAVKEEYEKLATEIFPDLRVGALHGKLKGAEKNSIMNDFSENKINILVATSVIEVGVDIPNASIMLIEGADRFGLAQLYQFRGRVGRAEHQSFCLLFTDSNSPTTTQRLQSLMEAKNGFELAEKDLAIRGPGEFLGHTQTGLPDLAMRSLNNIELIKNARLAADEILKKDYELKNYPMLKIELDKFRSKIHPE